VIAFLVGVFAWLKWPEMLGKIAFRIVVIAFAVTTLGILTRMWLEARPPVTNLYSSALFVGWGAVGLCVILEYVYRNAIGSVAAGLIGFATLLIAPSLPKIFADLFGKEVWVALPDRHALYVFPARPEFVEEFTPDLAERYLADPFAASCEVFSLQSGREPRVVAAFAGDE
jgi:hypothetical protein